MANQPPQSAAASGTGGAAASPISVGGEPSAAADATQAYQDTVKTGPPVERAAAGTPQEPKEPKISTLGDFRLLKKLGAGGMGAVYKAHQISLDRDVALKVLFKHLAANATFVQRFYREARIMARLDHPHIVRGYSVGEDHGWHYFAMEFIDGGSMQSWVNRLGKLPVDDALHIILACGRGLQHAHETHVVHRDMKPDNILLTAKGIVKIADLGLAKALDEDLSLTQSGAAAGTPFYMAPEQGRDVKHVDHRSDIYALGCALYRFLTGEVPFKGDTIVEVMHVKEEGRFVPARRLNSEVPERLDLIIDKMLAKNPGHRYQTCAELIKDLEGLGRSRPVVSFISSKAAAPTSSPIQKATKENVVPANTKASEWYVAYRTSEGKAVRKKLTTAQVRELLKEEDFDLRAKGSHTAEGGYRPLASYPEFEPIFQARLAKAKADHQAAKFQHLYEKIDQEEISRQRWRWVGNLFRGFVGWISLLVLLVALAGVGYLLYLFIPPLLQWIGARFGG